MIEKGYEEKPEKRKNERGHEGDGRRGEREI